MHDQAGAGGAFLALESISTDKNRIDRQIFVACAVNNDTIFATHLNDHSLDPNLPFGDFRCQLVNMKSNLHRTCESDEPRLWMTDDRVTDFTSASREKLKYTRWQTRLFEDFHHERPKYGGSRGGLQHDCVSSNQCRARHSGKNRHREVPWRNYGARSERDICNFVFFTWIRSDILYFSISENFTPVEIKKIDCLGGIGIGFKPALARLKDHRGVHFMFATFHYRRRLQQDATSGDRIEMLPPIEFFI